MEITKTRGLRQINTRIRVGSACCRLSSSVPITPSTSRLWPINSTTDSHIQIWKLLIQYGFSSFNIKCYSWWVESIDVLGATQGVVASQFKRLLELHTHYLILLIPIALILHTCHELVDDIFASRIKFLILSASFTPLLASTPLDTSIPKGWTCRTPSATFSGDKPPAK